MGNKFIKFKNKTLFFKHWIAEGIVSVKNLKISNGVLDIAYLSDIVKDKRNFHIEINMLNAALRATNIIISNEPVQDITIPVYIHHSDEMYNWTYRKSKYYYNHIIENVVTRPTAERYWENILGLRIDDNFLHTSYVCKVKQLKDKKLAETNFKILNNILPCNRNLFKWGKSDTNLCLFCQEEESVSHLLYDCIYAQKIWKLVNDVFHLRHAISHDDVIFGVDLDLSMNYVFSILIYYIYKEWLIPSLENKLRRIDVSARSLKIYLTFRVNIYSKCPDPIWYSVCSKLEMLIAYLENNPDM